MELGLKGKRAIITGASKGIGKAIALTMGGEGANLAVCARGSNSLKETVKDLESKGITVYPHTCDVGDKQSLESFLKASNEQLGGVDILINNTSGFGLTDDEQGWETGFNVDIMASVRATQTVVPWMESAGSGNIIHISSISGLEAGSPPAYAAVKAALVNHAKTMAQELAPKNIRVNCVAPGSIWVEGGFWNIVKEGNPEMYEGVLNNIPFDRLGTPEEVANVVTFLASDRASWVSGSTVVVDGVQHKGIF